MEQHIQGGERDGAGSAYGSGASPTPDLRGSARDAPTHTHANTAGLHGPAAMGLGGRHEVRQQQPRALLEDTGLQKYQAKNKDALQSPGPPVVGAAGAAASPLGRLLVAPLRRGQRNSPGGRGTLNATSTPRLLSPPFNHENKGLAHAKQFYGLLGSDAALANGQQYSKTRVQRQARRRSKPPE
jgi:hypothetical protein